MAVFGSPVLYPDHARRALSAALGLAQKAREFRAWLQQRFPDEKLPEFAIGIGIHTGEAIVGDIGSPRGQGQTPGERYLRVVDLQLRDVVQGGFFIPESEILLVYEG